MRILAIADFHGAVHVLPGLARAVAAANPDLVAFCGDVSPRLPGAGGETDAQVEASWETFLSFLGELAVPVALVPGNLDGPLSAFAGRMIEATRRWPHLHPLHGSCFPQECGCGVLGFGGSVTERERSDGALLQFPWWEAALGLLGARTFGRRAVLLLHTPPVGVVDLEGGAHRGSRRVNELIEELGPGFVLCGHAHNAQGSETIAGALVVNPGALKRGCYAILDTESRKVDLEVLAA